MTKKQRLYKETLIRVGRDQMAGVDKLLSEGHVGIAERHAVSKLMTYIKDLEARVEIDIPTPDDTITGEMKIVQGNSIYYI